MTTTAPTSQPITLEEARGQLRSGAADADDALIADTLIPAATAYAEDYLNRRIMPQVVELRLDGFPRSTHFGLYSFPRSYGPSLDAFPSARGFGLIVDPIRAVNSVKYYDTSNVLQTLATSVYEVDLTDFRGWIQLQEGQAWPEVFNRLHAVQIEMQVGWASAAAVPKNIKLGLLMLVAHFYENPEAVADARLAEVPMGAESLLSMSRITPV